VSWVPVEVCVQEMVVEGGRVMDTVPQVEAEPVTVAEKG